MKDRRKEKKSLQKGPWGLKWGLSKTNEERKGARNRVELKRNQ